MSLSNSQYQAIMRIYNERQYRDKHDLDRRRREIDERIPQIRELEDEIASEAVRGARKFLDGDRNAKEEMKANLEELRGKKSRLLAEGGYPQDYLDMRYHCADCRDTGYIGGQKCHCFMKEQIRLLYAQSNIEEILQKENFSAFSPDVYDAKEKIPELGMTVADYMKRVRGWCLDYVERFEKEKGSLLFTGGTGVGKTFLANCIAKALIDRCQSVIFLSANDLVDVFSRNKFRYESEEDPQDMYRHILDCDLLIIDDLGTEMNNTFVSSQLFYCINERLLRNGGTIITTNLSMSALRDTYSDRVSSRIISGYEVIPLYGGDLRTKVRGCP